MTWLLVHEIYSMLAARFGLVHDDCTRYRCWYMGMVHQMRNLHVFTPVANWGDQNSANVCPCTCRKRRLIIGYKLSYTTGSLYAWSSCMQWGVLVWTVGHWVVQVQVIYCSTGGWVLLFNKNQRHPWEEIMSYSHCRKPDLPELTPLP